MEKDSKLLLEMARKIQELTLENERLSKLAYVDTLTNLHNRYYYEEKKASMTKTDYPLTVISIDCNGLKRINDTFGHLMGDEYIVSAAEIVKKSLPEDAIVCRTGGDEFAVILKNCDNKNAQKYIENLHNLSGRVQISNGEFVSLSVGAAYSESLYDRVDNLFALADEEMYIEKRAFHKEKKLVKTA